MKAERAGSRSQDKEVAMPHEADSTACKGGHALRQAHPFKQRHQRQSDQPAERTLKHHLSPGSAAIHHAQGGDSD